MGGAEAASALVALRDVAKAYPRGTAAVVALDGVNVDIEAGEFVAVMGPSGSGKSTLLSILGCLDRPTRGSYTLAGHPVSSFSDEALSAIRNSSIGFVFQAFHLIPQLTVAENVETPLLYGAVPQDEWAARVGRVLAKVGLLHRADHRPWELSGGEAQRAAVARALVTRPQLVLADEPTGNLDGQNARGVFELMLELNRELGTSLVVVTHAPEIAARMQRVLVLTDGRLEPG